MDLIKILDMRKTETASRSFRWGLFYCPTCKKKVEKYLANGKKDKSCGCARSVSTTTHGLSLVNGKHHPLFVVWGLMKQRCYNPKGSHYYRYGGRGISVCGEWLNNFTSFYHWAIENGWKKELTIDRKDNDGNYEPGNCRFITNQLNTQNGTVAKLNAKQVAKIRNEYSASGETYKEFAKKYNVTGATISNIIRYKTWDNIY